MNDYEHDARVLVCVVNRPADLERVRSAGWYRIPFARAPQQLAFEYLAFYQTAAFPTERWSIRRLARVMAVGLHYRVEVLPDEPQHPRAQQLYYCFSLGPLKELRSPLPSRRLRRVSFIATTLGQLLRAADVTELWHAPDDRTHEVWGAGIGRRRIVQ